MTPIKTKENEDKRRVLTRQEAYRLQVTIDRYLADTEETVNDRHRVEKVADAMERDGQLELAREVREIHGTVKDLTNCKFEKFRYFEDGDPLGVLLWKAKDTSFMEDAKAIASKLDYVSAVLQKGPEINWEKSVEVLVAVNRERVVRWTAPIEQPESGQKEKPGGKLR